MEAKARKVFSLLIILYFSLYAISPLQHLEQGLDRGSFASLGNGSCINNAYGSPCDFVLSRIAQTEPYSSRILCFTARKGHSGYTFHVIKKSQIQTSVLSLVNPAYQGNGESKYFTNQAGLQLLSVFRFLASDNSPPFYSVHNA